MIRSLLNTFPSWALGVLCIGSFCLVAGAGLLLVRRFFPQVVRAEINDVAGITIGVVAAVYGIVLGFVIVTLYDDLSDARANVDDEATALVQLLHNTSGTSIEGRMRRELRTYVASVRFREFDRLAEGKSYAAIGDKHIDDMFAVLRDATPAGENRAVFHDHSVAALNDVVVARLRRLHDAREQLPTPFAVLLFVGAVLLIVPLLFLNVAKLRVHLTLVLAVAVVTSFNLLIAMMLDNPFSGDISVSSQPFTQETLGSLRATANDVRGP